MKQENAMPYRQGSARDLTALLPQLALRTLLIAGMILLNACGGAGESDQAAACSLCSAMADLKGSVSSQNGSQAQMQGWIVVALERDTGIARVGEVDAAGLYTLSQVRVNQPQTLLLLSPTYITQAVLSIPGTTTNTIRQYFYPTATFLPRLIAKGPIVSFQELTGLSITNDIAADSNGDDIPDGGVSLGASALRGFSLGRNPALSMLQGATVDTDNDGIKNHADPDLDGDGLPNWIDDDDNGNSILDVFDGDANGDLISDTDPTGATTDQYFSTGIEFLAVQFDMQPLDTSGTDYKTTLKFTTKVRSDTTPTAVQVRGAPTLLNTANVEQIGTDGSVTTALFSRQLGDDGLSEDGSPGDRVFAKKVTLENAKTPRAREMVFFQLAFGSPESPWFVEFPYAFPALTPGQITALYDVNTRTVVLVGNPFGAIQDFIWSINLFDSEGAVVWTSQAVAGTTRQFVIPENAMATGESYQFSIVAQTIDKVPGYPAYTIHTPKYDVE